jgi:hypothetical protein
MKMLVALIALLISIHTFAQQPRMQDYARGMTVDVAIERPVVEIVLPDELYQGIVSADLSDVRVFNGDGAAMPHAVCAADVALAPLVSREALNVFEVQTASHSATGAHVDMETAGGTRLTINEPTPDSESSVEVSAHVIDARSVAGEIRAIEFEWNSPDGASEARVQIQASDELNTWRTMVAGSVLLRVTAGTQELRRQMVSLPQQHYAYLRVHRVDSGPALRIESAQAEVVAPAVDIEPVWFAAAVVPNAAPRTLSFESSRLAPITFARLLLPQLNSSVRVVVRSRNDEQTAWRTQWSGEVYLIVANGERRVSAPPQFAATHDRFWQIEPSQASGPLDDNATLELGYRPAKLRFLAQGAGPFTLAYGSRRAVPAPPQLCDRLLADVNSQDMADLVVQAAASAPRTLGGDSALKPLPAKTPVRQMALWGILIAGVALLIGMSWSLFKRLKTPAAHDPRA